ncbi:MAG: hypothetical protein ACI4EJ_01740 [Bacteroides sp.]
MEVVQIITNHEETYTIDDSINDSINVLFSKLDEAIDDLENGRVISEEEMWRELDYITANG